MPSADVQRIENDSHHPRMLDLHLVLQKLRSVVSFMNTGAHPDDETSAMLAALGFRDGLDISYACANRGEGGQNDIGTETGRALGTLRTAEMERAAQTLDMRLYWLSRNTSDTISDFGFSKSGVETLNKWGHDHTLQRFVSIIRQEKPDILCPTFLDIPGQHGHHRAMTQLAHEAVTAAADSNFKLDSNAPSLKPWTVAKLYLPAWGGGGTAYDDELPPPDATITISADDYDELTGWSWEFIGQQSRRFHLTQGMGRWVASGDERNWPLHLAHSIFATKELNVTDHLPENLFQLSEYAQAPQLHKYFQNAQYAIDDAIDSFPDFNKIVTSANSALTSLRSAQASCPNDAVDLVQHRLDRKITQLSRVIRIASGVQVHAIAEQSYLRPGQSSEIKFEQRTPTNDYFSSTSCNASLAVDENWNFADDQLWVAGGADSPNPYRDHYFPDAASVPAVNIELNIDGINSSTLIDMVKPPVRLPSNVVNLSTSAITIDSQSETRTFEISIDRCIPETAEISIAVPDNWTYEAVDNNIKLNLPAELVPGLYELEVFINGKPAQQERIIDYPHAPARVFVEPSTIKVLILDIVWPDKRIAYVGGGNDRVAEMLNLLGLNVTELDDDALNNGKDLDQFDTLLVGLFAMRTRPALKNSMPHVHHWIEQGGHLLTLYHRPWDGWDPETVPPHYLEIGQPSLRYRVTDENAKVEYLQAEHTLLNYPNKITDKDWLNWHKERGLYFAKSWHESYQPLLSMHDPDEEPLTGSLLCAEIGLGRHTHTSLTLHHQLAHQVPGSFRLMANLLS